MLDWAAKTGSPDLLERGAPPMADVAYVVLMVAGFAVLALTLRGLERL